MHILKQGKRYLKAPIGTYEVEVQDHGYKSRPPVAVRVSGTRLGECRNVFGEPCYFFKCEETATRDAGVQLAQAMVAEAAAA